MLGYTLLALLPVAAAIYIVWAHRKRTAARAVASGKRFAEMFGTAGAPAIAHAGKATAARAPTAPGSAAPASALLCRSKEALLNVQQAALFRALTAAFPRCSVFPCVTLAALVELPPGVQGRDREQRLRVLAQNAVDCVVCDGDMRIMAAVDLDESSSVDSRIKSEYLKAAGVRYVRLPSSGLPGPNEIQRLVLGTAHVPSN